VADSRTFYSVSSKVYRGADTHATGLPVPTQVVLDLFPLVSGTKRNITTDNYYTSIPLAMELNYRKLTLVATMKKNKACMPPTFLTKTDERIVQYAFDHANNFTLFSVAPKKNKRIFFCPLCIPKEKTDEDIRKEGINLFCNQENVVWTVTIKCAACTPRQEKQTLGQ
jgi:hypothetical protein